MARLNKAQRKALLSVYRRTKLYNIPSGYSAEVAEMYKTPMSYLQFRRTVRTGPGCIMVPWLGMWLGIEPDGYTHS